MKVTIPSLWLSHSDIDQLQPTVMTVREIGLEEMKDDAGEEITKYTLRFDEHEKRLILNKTNTKVLLSLFGDESDNWIGKPVALTVQEVAFRGDSVPAIRVSKIHTEEALKQVAAPPSSSSGPPPSSSPPPSNASRPPAGPRPIEGLERVETKQQAWQFMQGRKELTDERWAHALAEIAKESGKVESDFGPAEWRKVVESIWIPF